jgi:hypothetical protein
MYDKKRGIEVGPSSQKPKRPFKQRRTLREGWLCMSGTKQPY